MSRQLNPMTRERGGAGGSKSVSWGNPGLTFDNNIVIYSQHLHHSDIVQCVCVWYCHTDCVLYYPIIIQMCIYMCVWYHHPNVYVCVLYYYQSVCVCVCVVL